MADNSNQSIWNNLNVEEAGRLLFGDTRMALVDIAAGFWGLRRQMEALVGNHLTEHVFQQAGVNGGASFAANFTELTTGTPLERLRACVAAYQTAGFGEFSIEEGTGLNQTSFPDSIQIHGRDTFESWAVLQNSGQADAPVCAYTAGVLVGFVNILYDRRDIVCLEHQCQAQDGDSCTFELRKAEDAVDVPVVAMTSDPGLERKINLLELLFDRMPMGIAILDREFNIQRFNPTWHEFSERFAPAEGKILTPGVNYFEHIPGSEPEVLPLFEKVLSGETVRENRVHLTTTRGESYWNLVLAPIFEGDNVSGILNVSIDVTQQEVSNRKLEAALEKLERREERLSLTLEGINDGIWDWQIPSGKVYYSPRWKALLGYQDQELDNQFETWQSLIHPEDAPRADQIIQEYLAGEREEYYLEHRLRHKDGSYRWILARGSLIRDEEGNPQRMLGSHTDITERKIAEEALKERELNLRSLIDQARNFAVYQVRIDRSLPLGGKVEFVSPSLKDIFGIGNIHDLGAWFAHLHPEDEERVRQAHFQALEEGCAYEETTRWFHTERQEWIYIHTASSPVVNDEGDITHYNGLILDITEQKAAENALERSLRFEKLITEISTSFINLDPDEIDQGIEDALGAVSQFMDVDRGYVFRYSSDQKRMMNTHEWCAEGIQPQISRMQDLSLEVLDWSNRILLSGEVLDIPDVQALPPEAAAEKAEFEDQDIQSLVCAPMVYRGETIGFVGFDSVRRSRDWDQENFQHLEMLASIITNALEHKRFQAIEAGQRQFLELLASGVDFQETLDSLLRIIEDQWPGMLGLVLLLDPDGKHLHIGSGISLPEDYLDEIEGLEIGPQVGSCGTASFTGKRVIVEDIEKDPRWDGLRSLAVQHGLQACWSEPIKNKDGSVIGTFAMYYRHPRSPSPEELRTIEVGAHLAGVAIEQKLSRQALQESQRTLSTLMSNLPGMAYRCKNDRSWTMEFVSQGSLELIGLAPEGLIGNQEEGYGDFVHPDDRVRVWNDIQEAVDRGDPFQITYRIIVDGLVKWVWEQGRLVEGEDNILEGFILDITERVTARENLEIRVEERTRELSTLLEISHNLTSTLDLDALLDQILDQLRAVIDYTAASIMSLDQDELHVIAYRGPIEGTEAKQIRFPVQDAGANRAVLEQRQPLIIDDVMDDTPLAEAIRKTAGYKLETTYQYMRCWMGIPLIVKDQLVGMLTLDQSEPNYYQDSHARIALAFANQAAVAVDNARLYQEAEKRARESEALFTVQKAITSELEMDQVLQMISEQARLLTETDISAVYLLDGDELEISYVSGDVSSEIIGFRLDGENSIAGRVVSSQSTILVEDTWEDPRVDRRASDQVGARSLLIAPLMFGETTIGTITVANRTPGRFNPESERLLSTLAANVVISLENARLYEEEQERREVAEGLRTILAVLNSDQPLDEILNQVIKQAVDLSGADAGAMYALVEESELVGVVASQGMPEDFQALSTFPVKNVPAHRKILEREPFLMEDIKQVKRGQDPDLGSFSEIVGRIFRASMTIPVVVKDSVFGAITLYYYSPQHFSQEDLQLAYSFADQAALAIENANLKQQAEQTAVAEERNRLARDLHDAVTQTLFSASLIAEVLPRIWEKDPQSGLERLGELRELTRGALAEMRTLLMELRPKSILETEFSELLEQLSSAFSGRTRIPVEHQLDNQGGIPDSVKVALYRILQESLNNIAKHARAEQVWIEVLLADNQARIEIADNGKGFDSQSIPAESLGLGIMKERAREIGASFSLESKPGEGTSVSVVWQAN